MTHNETVTLRLTGNGLVIERTEKSGGSTPWWWVSDESRVSKAHSQTYRYRETLKANGCRWSKKRSAWYFIGHELPGEIAALVDQQDTTGEPVVQAGSSSPVVPTSPRYSPRLTASAETRRETYQERILRRFVEQFQADLDRLTRCPALPAIATIRLDDPWA
jgi:hypothetical protein